MLEYKAPEPVRVRLGGEGGKIYELRPLAIGPVSRWRKAVKAKAASVVELLEWLPKVDTDKPEDMARLLTEGGDTILARLEDVWGLLCDFSPAIAKDRKALEDTALEPEIWLAFVEALKLAFPFGALAQLIPLLGSGAGASESQT